MTLPDHTIDPSASTVEGTDARDADRLSEVVTAAEIAQQPSVWRRVAADLAARGDEISGFLAPVLAEPNLRIVLTGAGTSAFAGRLLAPELCRTLNRRVDAVPTTDIVSGPREVFAEDVPVLLVSFARSGDSPESVAATELAEQCAPSVHHLIVTCNAEGRLAREHRQRSGSAVLLMPPESNDRGFAMTSSFTAMVLASWLVLTGAAEPSDLAERLAGAVEPLVEDPAKISELAGRGFERVVYLGSGGLAGVAQEAALKLLELTAGRVAAFHDSALGFRHGPKAVLNDQTLVAVFRSGDAYTVGYDDDIIAELRGGLGKSEVLVITGVDSGEATIDEPVIGFPGLDGLPDAVRALPFVVVAQLFALECSIRAGLRPDNPFPDGEVNRVVQGVTVHPLPA